jgi:CDP-glucose 4,6-dehydratase
MKLFGDVYRNKKVLITGNTGFKGSWLSLWLLDMGADVYGLSNGIPTTPSNYEVINLENDMKHFNVDISNFDSVFNLINEIKPDFIFHLAAQAIVKNSYTNPLEAFQTNVMGTLNILESLRILNIKCNAVMITSDKCYDNVEWVWGYKETDSLGGKDPYSASKGGAELVIKTYSESYFKSINSNVRIVSARAGNVIGGGDWASYRIIPDAVRSWSINSILEIRAPKSTRPWQHVLEPLSGYLLLGAKLSSCYELNGESFNFGPKPETSFSVEQLLEKMSEFWDNVKWKTVEADNSIKEAGLLKLNCDKALYHLNWVPNLNFNDTIKFVSIWYKEYYDGNIDMKKYTIDQINSYVNIANEQNLIWTK